MSRLLSYDYRITANGCTFVFSVVNNTAVNYFKDGNTNVFQLSEGNGQNKHRYNLTWDENNQVKWAFEQGGRSVRDPEGVVDDPDDDD